MTLRTLYLRLEYYAEAKEAFRYALSKHKGHVDARIGLAWTLYYQGDTAQAYDEFKLARWWAEK